MTNLLEIRELKTYFFTDEGVVKAVDGVSWSIRPGETVGLVGESGCGKSVTALSVLRLIPDPPGRIVGGEILFEGKDLAQLPLRELRAVRGKKISMVFQEPTTSLNPVYRVGEQIVESIVYHEDVDYEEAARRAVDMLDRVGIPRPADAFERYPHELSGGMKQRVMIAMALVCRPDLVICDEPTTALDVTVQAQILDLLVELQKEFGMAVVLITHNLGIVAEIARRAVVMYAGKIVEAARIEDLFHRPSHPYTIGLLRSIPDLNVGRKYLQTIPGNVPDPKRWPAGCRFHPRCDRAIARCRSSEPPLEETEDGRQVACWNKD